MAATKYTYSIFTDFPNQQVNPGALAEEISDSSISSAALLYIATSGDDCDIWFDDPLSSGDETTLDGLVAAHTGVPTSQPDKGGSLVVPLDTPSAPTVTPQGTPGSTTWGYKVTALSQSGETLASTEGQTTTGAAALNKTNYNRVTWAAVPGAVRYGIYRASAGGNPSTTGKMTEVAGLQFDDTGQAASGSEPSEDRSGAVIIGSSSSAASKVLSLEELTTDDNTVTSLLAIARRSTNTVLAGFGTGIYVQLEDATDVLRAAGSMHFLWADPDAADLDCDWRVMLRDGGSAPVERFRIKADGSIVVDGTTTIIDEATCINMLPVDGGIRGGTTTGSTNNDIAAVRFDTGGDGWNRVNIKPPSRYTTGDLTFRMYCSVPSAVGASKGTRWSLEWANLDVADSLPSSWPYNDTFTYDISNQGADEMFAIDFTIPAAQFDKTKGLLAMKMTRIGTDAADDCGVHIYVHGLELRFTGFRYAGQ
jgi:hypothetical protein